MGKKTQLTLIKRSAKAYGAAAALYLALIGITGLLLCYGPLPEKWIGAYMLSAEAAACLFLGLLAGSIVKKRGLLYGAGYAAVFSLLLLIAVFAVSGGQNPIVILRARRLLPVLCGGIGGIFGVNAKN